MSRLIDADELLEHVWRERLDSRERIANLVKSMPTIEERKIGKWIKGNDGYIRCSECGCRASAIKARFCHRCGTEMR